MIEVWLLITIGREFGPLPTLLMVIATAVIGVFWLRVQGFSTLMRLQERLASRQMPTDEIVEGVLLVVAGAFLLTPGFATDAIGFCLLITPSRRYIARLLRNRVWDGVREQQSEGRNQAEPADAAAEDPVVIEGEFSRIKED